MLELGNKSHFAGVHDIELGLVSFNIIGSAA